MRKKISKGIIIFASLSSIIIAAIIAADIYNMPDFFFPHLLFFLLFFVFWIITTTFLIRLKNWARIAYIIIHISLALITVNIYINLTPLFHLGLGHALIEMWFGAFFPFSFFIAVIIFSYSIIAIIYFSRSDTVKLFKQWIVNLN